jgi:L-lactate dehydrogenase complex protein LldG
LFCQWAETNNATVTRAAPNEVAGEVSNYLARNNLPAEAAMAPSPLLDGYDWASQQMLAAARARRGSDQVSITGAVRRHRRDRHAGDGVGPEHPVTLNLLPDTHIVVLREAISSAATRSLGAAARSATARDACRAR